MRVAVTGADGTLGAAVCARLRAQGHAVRRLVRRPTLPGDVAFALGAPVAPAAFEGVDGLVHCAHDFRISDARRAWEVNALGSARLLEDALARGVSRPVFVSTVACFDGCASRYGRGKRHVESVAEGLGVRVLRPGLLWGDPPRGLYGALLRVARLPVVPVFDGGAQPLALAHVDDVASAAVDASVRAERWPRSPVVVANPDALTLATLLRAIASREGRTLRLISLPSGLGLAALAAVERAGLATPFRRDSLVSLLSPPPSLDHAAAEALGLARRAFLRPA